MSIAHNFMSILIHRAGFMSIARYEFYDNIGSMYELCSYDKVSANVMISVQKMGESGHMVF